MTALYHFLSLLRVSFYAPSLRFRRPRCEIYTHTHPTFCQNRPLNKNKLRKRASRRWWWRGAIWLWFAYLWNDKHALGRRASKLFLLAARFVFFFAFRAISQIRRRNNECKQSQSTWNMHASRRRRRRPRVYSTRFYCLANLSRKRRRAPLDKLIKFVSLVLGTRVMTDSFVIPSKQITRAPVVAAAARVSVCAHSSPHWFSLLLCKSIPTDFILWCTYYETSLGCISLPQRYFVERSLRLSLAVYSRATWVYWQFADLIGVQESLVRWKSI
jgi:hypothetical protein